MSKDRYIPPFIEGESKSARAHRLKVERQARYRYVKQSEKKFGAKTAQSIKNLISGAHKHGLEFKNLREVMEFGDYVETRKAQTNDSRRYEFDLYVKEYEEESLAESPPDNTWKLVDDFKKYKAERKELEKRATDVFPDSKQEKPKRQYKRDARGRFTK